MFSIEVYKNKKTLNESTLDIEKVSEKEVSDWICGQPEIDYLKDTEKFRREFLEMYHMN